MRIGYRVVLACLLVLASLGGAALDCKVWLPLLPQDFDDMLGDEALVYQAGLSKPKAACVARREYISPKSLRKATIMILQGENSESWDYYDIERLLVVGKVPNVTWESVSGYKILLHMWVESQSYPARNYMVFSPKEGFFLRLDLESPGEQPAVAKQEMLRLGELLPLAKFAAECAKIR